MKKHFTITEYRIKHKRYAKKAHLKNLKRKGLEPDPIRRELYIRKMERISGMTKDSRKYVPLLFPKNFSIINNPEEVLQFFDDFQSLVNDGKPVDLKMENVTELTPDAILYLISIFKENRSKGIPYKVMGNGPKDEKARDLFVKSGFYRYVNSSIQNRHEDSRVFKIEEGNKCLPKVAKAVVDYARKQLSIEDRTQATKDVYSILIEVMTNTHNHASFKKDATWYLMAQHKDGEVHFAFLDTGLGIPYTLKKNFSEKIFKIFGGNAMMDHRLIKSALDGAFKTRTGEKKRGKGLPNIMQIADNGTVKDSVIISNLGYIDCSRNKSNPLVRRFHGTLVAWKIVKGE